jgi:hypothetical protein
MTPEDVPSVKLGLSAWQSGFWHSYGRNRSSGYAPRLLELSVEKPVPLRCEAAGVAVVVMALSSVECDDERRF